MRRFLAQSSPDAVLFSLLHGEDEEERDGHKEQNYSQVDIGEPGKESEQGTFLVVDVLHHASADADLDRFLRLAELVGFALNVRSFGHIAAKDTLAVCIGHIDGDGGIVLDDIDTSGRILLYITFFSMLYINSQIFRLIKIIK